MKRAVDTRMQRLKKIQQRLLLRPKGATAAELAHEFEVSKPTIIRDLRMMEDYLGTAIERKGRRYILNTRKLLHALMLSRDELLAIYLAVRLLSRHSDEHNPHVVMALEKLAEVLQGSSPLIARHIAEAAEAVRTRKVRGEYVHSLEVLTQGWAEQKLVRFRYRSYSKDEVTERLFAPYFVEPSGIGYACYVFGYDLLRNAIRTFKVERIYEASPTEEPFEIPSHFDVQQHLASAWNVIWGDAGDITVILHFEASVVRRVKESTWHHTQEVRDLPDGSCLFMVRIGSTKELLPWVRGWGAAVEVLEPVSFRQEMIAETQKLAHLYGMEATSKQSKEQEEGRS